MHLSRKVKLKFQPLFQVNGSKSSLLKTEEPQAFCTDRNANDAEMTLIVMGDQRINNM